MSVQIHRLSNGMRVVTERMPGLKSAAIGVWVTAGGRNERADQNGMAHFLEHMAFKGTHTRSALQIAEVLEDVGGYINAYTSREMTAYYARVLEDDVMLAMDVIADVLLNATYEPSEIEVERGVILQEINQALDTPDDIIFDWLQDAAYPGQALGRTILGEPERVGAFSRDDLCRFVREQYGPGQLILSAAGSVDHDTIVAEAERLFGHLTPAPTPVAEPARFRGGEYRRDKALEQAHFTLGLEGPGYRDDEIYTAQVFATALGGGMSSRLFQELRETRGLCYTIFAQASAYADTGMTTIYAGTGGDQVADLAAVTIEELRRATDDLSDAELARAKAQLKAGLLIGLESPSNRAERLARTLSIWDRVPALEETVAMIDAVDRPRTRAYAAGLATTAPAAMALYGPVGQAPGLDDLRSRLAA